MNLQLELQDSKTAFRPGELVRGEAKWSLAAAPGEIEIRLFWYTEGKGTRDLEVVAAQKVDNPSLVGERKFEFTAPPSPHSLAGRLISILWAIEIVVLPEEMSQRTELVISPFLKPIELSTAADN